MTQVSIMILVHAFHAIMSTRARTLFAGFLLVAVIAAGSNLAVRPEWVQARVLGAPVDPLSTEGVNLTVAVPEQSSTLEYGSQAEVFRFSLSSDAAYTLRYLTLAVNESGLKLSAKAEDWKIYEVKNGQVDFSAAVGYGEQWSETFLKMRLQSGASVGYSRGSGKQTFALVTSVLKDPAVGGTSEAPWLEVSIPNVLPSGLDWAFVPGVVTVPWMDVSAPFASAQVHGLPIPDERRS